MLGVQVAEQRVFVFGSRIILAGFVVIEQAQHVWRQLLAQLGGIGHVGRDAGGHVGDDQALEAGLVVQGVFQPQHAPPGVAEQVELVQFQRLPDLLKLLAEAFQRPQAGVVRLVGVGRAELVVIDQLDVVLGQKILEAGEVFVGTARPAVQRQKRNRARAQAFGPHPVATRNGDHPNTAGLDLAHRYHLSSGGVRV